MALDIDTDGFRRAGELVDTAGQVLGADFDDDVPPCGADEVSRTVMDNLNARRRWLMQHVRAGVVQTSDAAAGINQTATGFEAEDTNGASLYGADGGNGAGAAPSVLATSTSGGSAPPAGMPTLSAVPDLSGMEGETLAQALEAGVGPGPAAAAAARLAGLASKAVAANVTLAGAHTQLLASGESAAHPGLEAKLARGIAWTEAVSGHATALAGDYEAAGALHTTTLGEVGPSTTWRTLKTGYQASVEKNIALAGMAQAEVDAWHGALTQQEQRKGTAMTGYQTGGETLSAPPGHLPDPGLDPNGDSEESKKGDKSDKKSSDDEDAADPAKGMQSMLEPVMGAVGPLMQSLGKANPLQQLGQIGQQLGQQVGKLGAEAAKKAASPPLKPAALAKPNAAAGKGGGGGGKGGGGSPIKPVSSLGGATHASSLAGTPPSSPPSTPIKPAAAAGASPSASGSGGMGMMPMGARGAGGDTKASKINSYEQPLPEVDDSGRPGVEGQSSRPAAPVVNPESQNAVKERLARRKKDAAADGEG